MRRSKSCTSTVCVFAFSRRARLIFVSVATTILYCLMFSCLVVSGFVQRIDTNVKFTSPLFCSPSPSTFEEQKSAVFKRINERILNSPVGALTKDMVKEAKACMEANVHQAQPRKVELLLKRVVDEKCANQKVVGTIGADWYNLVMRAWMMKIRCNPLSEEDHNQNILVGQRVFEIFHFMVSNYLEILLQRDTDKVTKETVLLAVKPNLLSFCLAFASLDEERHSEERCRYILPSLRMILIDVAEPIMMVDFEDVLHSLQSLGVDPTHLLSVFQLIDLVSKGQTNSDVIEVNSECIKIVLASLGDNALKSERWRIESISSIIESLIERMRSSPNIDDECYEIFTNLLADFSNVDIYTFIDRILSDVENKGIKSAQVFSNAMIIWSKEGTNRGLGKVEEILNQMESINLQPDLRTYNSILKMYSIALQPKMAESLLTKIHDRYLNGTSIIKPDVASFTIVINAWANSSIEEVASDRAQRLFKWMLDFGLSPSPVTFTAMLYCLARNEKYCTVESVQSIFEELEINYGLRPTTQVMNAYVHALASCNDADAAELAEEALYKMEEMYENGDKDVAPGVVTYTCVISAFAKSNIADAGFRAEKILYRMETSRNREARPNARSYNAALAAWAKSRTKGAASRAQLLLDRMNELYLKGNVSLKPDVYSYTTTIHAWARSVERDSAQRATRLLQKMESLSKTDPDLTPNMHTYTSVINAWARSKERNAADRAQQIINKMESNEFTRPNVNFYTAAIDCFAKTKRLDAAQKADAMLKRMEERVKNGDLSAKPNVRAYNAVINAWSWSNDKIAAKRCEEILSTMEARTAAGDKDVTPNTITYSTIMCVYARSSEERKAYRCWQLLRKMDDLCKNGYSDAKPNVLSYTSVINACAKTRGGQSERSEALKIAYDTFKELEDSPYGRPNYITFSVFMKACHHLLPKSDMRNNLIELIFKKARAAGQVEQSVLKQFHFSTPHLFHKAFINEEIIESDISTLSDKTVRQIVSDLPQSWTRNVYKTKTDATKRH